MGVPYRKNISRAFQHPPSCVAFPGGVTERTNVNNSNMAQNTDEDKTYAYTTNVHGDLECAIKQTVQHAAS
jgi:hypothetical protein